MSTEKIATTPYEKFRAKWSKRGIENVFVLESLVAEEFEDCTVGEFKALMIIFGFSK